MNINTDDNVEVKEKLTNTKPWFNGVKTFPSVKVNPPQEPSELKINVADEVASGDKLV